MRILIKVLRQSFQYKNWMALSALLGFLSIGSGIGLIMTSAYIIAKAALHPSVAELQVAIVGVRFFGISRGIFRYFERLVSHDTTFRLLARFRIWFYEKLEPLAPARLQQYKSADLHERIVSDVETLEHIFTRVIYPPLVALFISILMFIILAQFSFYFSFLILVFHLLAGVISPLIIQYFHKGMGEQLTGLRKQINIMLVDTIQGLNDLILLNRLAIHRNKLFELQKKYLELQQKSDLLTVLSETIIGFLTSIAILLSLIKGVTLINTSQMDGVYLPLIILGILASFEAVINLPPVFHHSGQSIASARRLYEIIDAEPQINDTVHKTIFLEKFDIRFKNIFFQYPDSDKPIFENLNISIPEKSKTAILGDSGMGKTTIFNLLLRFWDYRQGEIKIGGIDIRSIPQEQVRTLFAVVSQQTYLFNGTIKDNILLANPHATDNEIIEALEIADLLETVKRMPNTLNTFIGDQGMRLSGGERQRLSIARALLKDAPILLFDEAASNLDMETEKRILDTFWQITDKKTVLLISHRIDNFDGIDQIIHL
jgi:ATP-binding cassette subfamily C protein CydC